jgi:hypothetical protein
LLIFFLKEKVAQMSHTFLERWFIAYASET